MMSKIALWNPDSTSFWNFLFTPAFGAWIHARNWSALGEDKRAQESMYWFFGILNLVAWMMTFLPVDVLIAALWLINCIWHFEFSKLQEAYVKDKIGNCYERRSWRRPLAFATGSLIFCLTLKSDMVLHVCR